MASEIRVNKISNRAGLSTVEYTDTGVIVSGIVTCTEISGLNALNIAGVSTFASPLDINGDIDVDGHTNLDNLSVAGVSTFSDDVTLTGASGNIVFDKSDNSLNIRDGAALKFGDGNDLIISHGGAAHGHVTFIDEAGAGRLRIRTNDFVEIGKLASAEKSARFFADGQVELYFNDVKKLHTDVGGVIITGVTTSSGGFSGNLTGNVTGNADTATLATRATDLAINGTNQLVYQASNNDSAILPTGNAGQILQSNGSGSAPQWVTSAPAGAIEGITVRDESSIVGTANSISTINFVGSNVTADAAALAGISTVQIDHMTIQDEGSVVGTAGSISTLNFVGTGIAAAVSGSTATITASGGATTDDVVALAIALG